MSVIPKKDLSFIHPYDDIDVIAGQATIAKEILSQLEEVDLVFVPVGGGGLISEIKRVFLKRSLLERFFYARCLDIDPVCGVL